ncbi:MAG TPA: DUF72 domain-containing protein [Polyangiaceae bacterium]|nr:DUF72 domain-containing protein [Polyangiaceae bacterium]
MSNQAHGRLERQYGSYTRRDGSSESHVHIGVSGWRYPEWRGVFYPPGLRHADELAYAAVRFDSMELNGSFYSLQRPSSYDAWAAAVPDGFVFAVKGSRFITHMKRLSGGVAPLANFFASGVLRLGAKLGPLLWQLPASFAFDAGRLAAFFGALPRTHAAAASLARRHDARVSGRCALRPLHEGSLRHAIEVRHPSFACAEFLDLARAHGVAVVVADTAGHFPGIDEPTADFTYVRLHGDADLYVSGYEPAAIARWAARVRGWSRRGDVYVYFDNTAAVRAPVDALALRRALEREP